MWVLQICERIIHYYTLTCLKQTEHMCTGKDKHLVLLPRYGNLFYLLQVSENLLYRHMYVKVVGSNTEIIFTKSLCENNLCLSFKVIGFVFASQGPPKGCSKC